MATTELKTLEKLVKEILEKVKKIGEQKPKEEYDLTLDKINTKLDTIDERLAVPSTNDSISAELISKVDEINTNIEKKAEDYIKEIQNAFEKYKQTQNEIINNPDIPEGSDIKGFVSIITNEMMELKNQFEKFNTEFTDISLNTGMTMSKEIISLKNYVLSLNDTVDNIKQKVEDFNTQDSIVVPITENLGNSLPHNVEEVFKTALTNFKKDVFNVIAKISKGIEDVSKQISEVSDNLKTFEGLEISIGEIIENQQKNKADILKIIQNNIEEENKKLLPQIMQLVNSISFDESAEDIKDGLYAVNENLGIVNKNIEVGSKSTEQILNRIDEITQKVKETSKDVSDIVKNDISEKINKIDSTLDSVTNEFNVITRGTKDNTDEYIYTLLDLESDISKVRVILDELNHSIKDDKSLAENVTKNISDKISNLNTFVEKTSTLYASPDYKALLMQFDALNDDITSISKRTNKLILTSDDASEKLQKNIEDFQQMLVKICTAVKSFENSGALKTLNIRTENIQKLLLNSVQSDRAINEAFVYLASWIDNTSAEIKKIGDEVASLKIQNDYQNEYFKNIIAENQTNEETDSTKLEKLIKETNKKLIDNSKKMEIIEQKLDNIPDFSEIKTMLEYTTTQAQTNKTLSKKIDKMEKQIQQLLSYVEEEED